jgi:hypothetical protein
MNQSTMNHLYRFPQNTHNKITTHCPSRIIYGITKYLYYSVIDESLAIKLGFLLESFFNYLLTLINNTECSISIIQPTYWSNRGIDIFNNVIDKLNRQRNVVGSLVCIPYHTNAERKSSIIQAVQPRSPIVPNGY